MSSPFRWYRASPNLQIAGCLTALLLAALLSAAVRVIPAQALQSNSFRLYEYGSASPHVGKSSQFSFKGEINWLQSNGLFGGAYRLLPKTAFVIQDPNAPSTQPPPQSNFTVYIPQGGGGGGGGPTGFTPSPPAFAPPPPMFMGPVGAPAAPLKFGQTPAPAPAVRLPVAPMPAGAKPAAPAGTKPGASAPAPAKPGAPTPAPGMKPGAPAPAVPGKPGTKEIAPTNTAKPGNVGPSAPGKPAAPVPGAAKPGSAAPAAPGMAKPGSPVPGVPKSGAPKPGAAPVTKEKLSLPKLPKILERPAPQPPLTKKGNDILGRANPGRARTVGLRGALLDAGAAMAQPAVLGVVLIVAFGTAFVFARRAHLKVTRPTRRNRRRAMSLSRKRRLSAAAALAVVVLSMTLPLDRVLALTTVPLTRVYNGHLFMQNNQPVTGPTKLRFSYWKSPDFVDSDRTGTGAINTNAPMYAFWQEEHFLIPDPNGFFSVRLGSIAPLPDLSGQPLHTLLNLHLQVEVKPGSATDTAYDVLDTDPANPANDRSPILSVPFARNADLIDQHDAGFQFGNIPYLQTGATLPASTIPGGTNMEWFMLDADGSGSASTGLVFGNQLGKTLSYDIGNNRFNFNGDVRIQGNLTVTGTINGIGGQSGSSTGALLYHAEFQNASYKGDGSNNTGQLSVQHDPDLRRNYYQWTSTRPALQDYDIYLRVTVPYDFKGWMSTASTNPISLTYKSLSPSTTNNKLDVNVFDTNGSQVTLSGSSVNLVNTAWTTAQLEFSGSGSPTWTPGQDFLVRFRMYAKDVGAMQLGDFSLKY